MAEERIHSLSSIKVVDLIHMVDPMRFRTCMAKLIAKKVLADAEVEEILRKRSEWLWMTYKPADMEWHRQFYNRRKRK